MALEASLVQAGPMQTLGQRIKALRKAKRMSVVKLAEECDVSRAAVYHWEDDITVPTLSNLVELSRIFDVSLGALVGFEGSRVSVDDELRRLPKESGDVLAKALVLQLRETKKLPKTE